MGDPHWRQKAACRDNPDAQFPGNSAKQIAYAKAVCDYKCQVKDECLAFALSYQEPTGIWGGLTPRERKALTLGGPREKRPRKARKNAPKCGTRGGYQAHHRYGEKPCGRCSEANAAATRPKREQVTQ